MVARVRVQGQAREREKAKGSMRDGRTSSRSIDDCWPDERYSLQHE